MIKPLNESINQPLRFWLWISVFFIAGIILANVLQASAAFLYTFCIIFLLASFLSIRKKKLFFICFLLLILGLGFLRFEIAEIRPSNHIGKYTTKEKEKVLLAGTIENNPVETKSRYGTKRVNFLFKPSYLIKNNKSIKTSGLVKVSIYGKNFADFKYGQSYILEGLLYKPKGSLSNEQFNYREYLKKKGIYALFYSRKYDGCSNLQLNRSNSFLKMAYDLKNNLKQKYKLLLPYPYNSLLSAFILGDREDISKSLYNSFVHTGSVHILAISGLHIAIIIFILVAVFKILRIEKKLSVFLSIGFLIFYCFLTGARPSVIRASIMVSVFLLGWVLARDSDIYNSLGLSCLLILLLNPYQLFDVGFQLSFMAVLSIVYFTPKLEKAYRFLRGSVESKFRRYILKGATASLSAWLGTFPIALHYFGVTSDISVLTNLIILPLLSITLGLGILVSIFSFIWMDLANIFSQTLWLVLSLMVNTIRLLERIPFSYFKNANFSISAILLYYIVLISIFNCHRVRFFRKRISSCLVDK